MTIAELLKDFSTVRSDCDTVQIVTNDSDFGDILTHCIVNIEEFLTAAEYTEFRIMKVLRWWINTEITTDVHKGPWSIVTTLIIHI